MLKVILGQMFVGLNLHDCVFWLYQAEDGNHIKITLSRSFKKKSRCGNRIVLNLLLKFVWNTPHGYPGFPVGYLGDEGRVPRAKMSSFSCNFQWKLVKYYVGAPCQGLAPLLWEILDPPLNFRMFFLFAKWEVFSGFLTCSFPVFSYYAI